MEILPVILIVQAVTTILLIRSRRTLLLSNLALRQPFDWLRTGSWLSTRGDRNERCEDRIRRGGGW